MPADLTVLIVVHGSGGDVYPAIGIGRGLRQRGHSVTLATNPYFEKAVREAGIGFAPIGTAEEGLAAIENPDLWKRGRGFKLVFEGALKAMPESYGFIASHNKPGSTVIVANALALGARVANEKLSIPLATTHLQPMLMRSIEESSNGKSPFARQLRKLAQVAIDRWVLDPAICPGLNAFRSELGLPPVRGVLKTWIHSPQVVIGLFPEWFAAAQSDWPAKTKLTGFPLFDDVELDGLPDDVAKFLDEGESPVVFTLGTAMRFARAFFEVSSAVCQKLGCRGMLLTKFPEQVPASLPDGVRHYTYAPFSKLLPRAAALVHHGGIGTVSQALAAGIPQLCTPFNFDQPDNAARLTRLGVGDFIRPRRYDVRTVAPKLGNLLRSRTVAEQCRIFAGRLEGSNALGKTCDLIESLVTPAIT